MRNSFPYPKNFRFSSEEESVPLEPIFNDILGERARASVKQVPGEFEAQQAWSLCRWLGSKRTQSCVALQLRFAKLFFLLPMLFFSYGVL